MLTSSPPFQLHPGSSTARQGLCHGQRHGSGDGRRKRREHLTPMTREGRKRLFPEIPRSCLKRARRGWDGSGGRGSTASHGWCRCQLLPLPAQMERKNPQAPQGGVPLRAGASLLSNWAQISDPAASTEHGTRPGSFPLAGWFTGMFPTSANVKPEWLLDLHSPNPPIHTFSKCS